MALAGVMVEEVELPPPGTWPADLPLRLTASGLYCEAGDFFIDPWRPVDRAVITHAHSDHARAGSGAYLTAAAGVGILHERVGANAAIEGVAWGERRTVGGVTVSFHPAGHILGSAQIRLEVGGDVTVISGDYKTVPDPSCEAWEPVRARTFITESTFGLPIYRWPEQAAVMAEIRSWWAANAAEGVTSVVLAYPLGKSQRVLVGLAEADVGPIVVAPTAAVFLPHYAAAGRRLPAWEKGEAGRAVELKGRALVVASPAVLETPWMRRWAPYATSFASGWMAVRGQRRRSGVDRGWVLSDHADWAGLHAAIAATGAERIGVTHGSTATMVRWLREQGRDAFAVPTRFSGEQ